MLKFLCDECCEGQIVSALRAGGHDVSYVAEWGSGLSDPDVSEFSLREQRVLVTKDLGIWPPARERRELFGLVLTRLDRLAPDARAERVLHVVALLGAELIGQLTLVSPTNVRTRRLDARR